LLFTLLAVICIFFLIGRRYVVGGELGGTSFGRNGSCIFLVFLWVIYITLSTLQAYGKLGNVAFGINENLVHR